MSASIACHTRRRQGPVGVAREQLSSRAVTKLPTRPAVGKRPMSPGRPGLPTWVSRFVGAVVMPTNHDRAYPVSASPLTAALAVIGTHDDGRHPVPSSMITPCGSPMVLAPDDGPGAVIAVGPGQSTQVTGPRPSLALRCSDLRRRDSLPGLFLCCAPGQSTQVTGPRPRRRSAPILTATPRRHSARAPRDALTRAPRSGSADQRDQDFRPFAVATRHETAASLDHQMEIGPPQVETETRRDSGRDPPAAPRSRAR